MKNLLGLALVMLATAPAYAGDWKPIERVESYSISGDSGIALYRSIGEKGPKVGVGRAIAFTDFKLTWRRDYQERNGDCVLAGAVPKLIITYRWPEPAGALSADTRKLWDRFIDGVKAHERVHGKIITEMVEKIEAVSIGLSEKNDPGCHKVRAQLQKHLGALSLDQRARSRAFDREEMRQGGNVHRLVNDLING